MFLSLITAANAKCDIKITNYRGDIIAEENYTTNTQSFKINSTNCKNLAITPERDVLYGIYDIGEYTITASGTNPDDENVTIKININEVPKEKRNYYYIINHCGIFPMITSFFYLIFNLTRDINMELQINRYQTFNFTKITEDYPNTIYYSSPGDSLHTYDLIRNISRDDPNSYFHVRVDDIRVG
ncbi:hypothetical protein TVAG_010550 [Trichomonas vaginalis G3]|uniref:Uncharacterized protein n=1 Tax=Trichomonas vaginalis (strain ATCC PRA-98 / G3) TaxID=412133 RepID=A2DNY2_TRIV3|nr:hypothetical protein TVAGG3_0990060 [Trichomonas vaginalis G3]EAY17831.1 hypothetical protein TVAG_010550 [Trichomonas vaginalis G3]KAI5489968.1 hypothetical protein TVAGG3_0990060 [Trichomonas vaginalis G3]|eukprot:XP_001329966.1 hypothetical protein [Trichomonas vaginalis G3]